MMRHGYAIYIVLLHLRGEGGGGRGGVRMGCEKSTGWGGGGGCSI